MLNLNDHAKDSYNFFKFFSKYFSCKSIGKCVIKIYNQSVKVFQTNWQLILPFREVKILEKVFKINKNLPLIKKFVRFSLTEENEVNHK